MYEEDRENREDRDQEIERTEIMDDVDALNMALQNGEIDMIAQLPAANQFIPVTGKQKVRFFTECKLDYPKPFF